MGQQVIGLYNGQPVNPPHQGNTGIKGHDDPSGLDLLFTSDHNDSQDMKYQCPSGKTNHLVIEIKIAVSGARLRNEAHTRYKYKYGWVELDVLRR